MIARRLTLAVLMSLCLFCGALAFLSALAWAAVGVEGESVSSVTADSATLQAMVDPGGAPTTYYFQYGTTGGYGTDVPVAPGALVGSGTVGVEVSQHVQGLLAGTIYHYRVVALSEVAGHVEELADPDQTFTTQRSGSGLVLPDGRSWELVTPPDKHGALFYGYQVPERNPQASVGGNAIVDVASQPTEAEPQGYTAEVSVLSTRGAAGWSSQVIAPPHDKGTGPATSNGQEYRFFSEDLSRGVLQPFGDFTPLSPETSESTPYLRTDYLNGNVNEHCDSSCFQPLVTATNTRAGAVFGGELNGSCLKRFICGPRFLDATPDLSHIILSSPVQLTPTPGSGDYEWSSGQLQLLPGGLAGIESIGARHAISADGGRVILAGGGLYLRDVVKDETIRLDVPQSGPSGFGEGKYMTASSDDSRVFFLDSEHLTAESSASGPDLYEYDLNAPLSRRLTDLSVDGNAGESADVQTVLGTSDDGSYVYFTAAGALAGGSRPSECKPENSEADTCNVYVRHDGVTRLVAAGGPEEESARVSPDGRWLAFMSDRDLTGYDTRDAVSGRLDEEVYLYDATANKLVCASCNPTGARPVGFEYEQEHEYLVGATLGSAGRWLASSVPRWTTFASGESLYQPRYLSDSGRLFFNSKDALVPQDVNGTEDVYEYEPAGTGSCSTSSVTFSEQSGGCVGLISSGTSPEESAFLDASGTGGDVFILTLAKLTSRDYDNALDVYDAHECSPAAPCYPSPPVSPPACSTGDSCKAAPSPQPSIFGPVPSATFSGAGNIALSVAPVVTNKSLTKAQKLAQALRTCRMKSHRQRSVCERNARKRYGAGKSRKASANQRGRG